PHDRQVVPTCPMRQYRRFPSGSVSANHGWQQVEAGFIGENQGAALSPSTAVQLRPGLRSPALDLLFVALNRTGNGNLRGPTHRLEHSGHMILVKTDTEFPAKNFGNAGTG